MIDTRPGIGGRVEEVEIAVEADFYRESVSSFAFNAFLQRFQCFDVAVEAADDVQDVAVRVLRRVGEVLCICDVCWAALVGGSAR